MTFMLMLMVIVCKLSGRLLCFEGDLILQHRQRKKNEDEAKGRQYKECLLLFLDGCIDGWMTTCMIGWLDGWMDGFMFGRIIKRITLQTIRNNERTADRENKRQSSSHYAIVPECGGAAYFTITFT